MKFRLEGGELIEKIGGRQERRERGRVLFILNKIEVTTDKGVNRIVCGRHCRKKERIKGEITTFGVKINIENLKRLVRTRKRGIPAELNKATRNGRKGDITRDKVFEDAGGVNDSSTPTVHTQVVPRNKAVREGKGKPFVGSQMSFLDTRFWMKWLKAR